MCVAATFVCLLLRNLKPEFSVILSVVVSVAVLIMCANQIKAIIEALEELMQRANIENEQITLIIKILGVSYITDFGSEICKDAGENSLGQRINLAGKIFILFLTTPLILSILEITSQLF